MVNAFALRTRDARGAHADDSGFTLLETVFAGAILVIASVIALQFFGTAINNTSKLRGSDEAASVADSVLESQAASSCSLAVVPAGGASGCGGTYGDSGQTVARDGRQYQVQVLTNWVSLPAAAGEDPFRLEQKIVVTANGTSTTKTRLTPISGTAKNLSGTATVTVSGVAAGGQVAMIVGANAMLVHTVGSGGTVVFPYIKAGSYRFARVTSGVADVGTTFSLIEGENRALTL